MPNESHRHNPIFSSLEQILGEERKLHHIATSETMTSSNRYFSLCWFVSDKPHLHLNQFLHKKLVNKSNAEAKVEFVVVLHRNLPSFWSSGLPPPVALLLRFDQRSRWRDAEFSGSSPSPFSRTELDNVLFFFVLSPALKLLLAAADLWPCILSLNLKKKNNNKKKT